MSNTKQWLTGALAGIFVAGGMILVWKIYQKQNISLTQKKQSISENFQRGDELNSVRERFSFAPYTLDVSKFVPSVPGTKARVEELNNLKNFENPVPPQERLMSRAKPFRFSIGQKKSLAEKNFFVASVHDLEFDEDPNAESARTDDWTQIYERIGGWWGEFYRAPENAPFITTDYTLHVYHRLLEKEFEHAEQTVLYGHVHSLSRELFDKASEQAIQSTGPEKESFERLGGYFMVPLALTESVQSEAFADSSADTKVDTLESALEIVERYREQMDSQIADQVKGELRRIFDASVSDVPPLLGKYQLAANPNYQEDYTQFNPRSHYDKNSILRSYFRSMMWFGRQNLLAASPDLTRDSLVISQWLSDPELKKEWEAIYVPTTFFVGESDDLGIYEYQDILGQIGNKASFSSGDIQRAQVLAKEYRAPAILSSVLAGDDIAGKTKKELLESTRGFRFFGQRFTPDAFIFNQLTKGQERGPKLPSTPTALMVMSAFGDRTSNLFLSDWIDKNAPDSRSAIKEKLGELEGKFSDMSEDMWTQNIYWGWIRTLKTLFQDSSKLAGYPYFMKGESWRVKDTNAALGSWTELKHDTLLYAKQSYAELGGGGDEPEHKPTVPKGYVEPNVEYWDRLLALSRMTYQGMNDFGLLDQVMQGRNEQFLDTIQFFRSIALQEIENKVISEADFERLRMEPGKLKNVIAVLPGDVDTEDNARAALVADVHTDVPGAQILYEANGKPDSVFVAVKDANGARLTRGLVYRYYEFTGPLAKRLTDKDWRAAVYNGKDLSADDEKKVSFPEVPAWTDRLR